MVVTVATESPDDMVKTYRDVFHDLGLRDVDALDIRTREDARDEGALRKLQQASVVFFTGGDQLRITSQIGDTPLFRCLQEVYGRGATIAGTSAGAAAMPETMLISGPGDTSYHISAIGRQESAAAEMRSFCGHRVGIIGARRRFFTEMGRGNE